MFCRKPAVLNLGSMYSGFGESVSGVAGDLMHSSFCELTNSVSTFWRKHTFSFK